LSQSFEEKRRAAAQRLGIGQEHVPRHVAIIMDGNGRWATAKGLPRLRGHEQGAKTVEQIAKYCVRLGIEYLTLYSFSMQNWKRPAEEVDFLMHLYALYLEGIRPSLMENNVRLLHLGRTDRLPESVIEALEKTMEITRDNSGMVLGLALNYGARAEIVEAVRKIAFEHHNGTLALEDIDQDCVSNHLYTAGWCDPDLLIRTSGELRVSNFLLWQISYAEFYVTETLWPDFSKSDIDDAIKAYAQRSRRFGDVTAHPAG
jgi:undecaprenyl diphosphate synthase